MTSVVNNRKTGVSILSFIAVFSIFYYIAMVGYPYLEPSHHFVNAIFSYCIVMFILYCVKGNKYIAIVSLAIISGYSSFIIFYSKFYGGFIDLGSFASIMESPPNEAYEFILQLDKVSMFLAILIGIVLFICLLNLKSYKPKINLRLLVFIPLILIVFIKLLIGFNGNDSPKVWVTNSFSKHFAFDSALLVKEYFLHVAALREKIYPTWSKAAYIEEDVDIYMVVIGESELRSHMSLYGYERETTSPLNEFKGITLITDAVSPAAQTRHSIPRLLALNHLDRVDYNKNIIDLAKNVGFETYWLSNQGFIGRHDTPTTKIATRADHVQYLNKGDFSRSGYDIDLLPLIQSAILSEGGKKLIFVHLLGSHPEFCSRVWEETFAGDKNYAEDINCYDDSIRNTSLLVSKVLKTLKHYKFKLIYTADHGFFPIEEPPYFVHGVGDYFSRLALEVPLILWDGKENSNTIIEQTYFMRNYVNTLADFLNIRSPDINYKQSVISNEYRRNKADEYVIKSSGAVYRFDE